MNNKLAFIAVLAISGAALGFNAYRSHSVAQSAEVKQYVNTLSGYRVDYSNNFSVKEDYGGKLARFILSEDKKVSVAIYQKQNTKELSIDEWAHEKFGKIGKNPMEKQGDVVIDGVQGLKYKGDLHGDSIFIFLPAKDNMLEIEYYTPYGQQERYFRNFESLISSIKLID
ncbi:MAG TPA: hypothetical protein PKD79_02155 [Candidatus Doudnabacteria bacterium]|nr:hypothetical protein [Candidatus Doudnabacteria bacterium]